MKGIITLLSILIATAILVFVPPLAAPFANLYGQVDLTYCAAAIIICCGAATIAGFIIRSDNQHGAYLFKLFMFALFVRIIIGAAIFVLNGQDFFGGDAWTYDSYGYLMVLSWRGDKFAQTLLRTYTGEGLGSAWGMIYLVGAVYGMIGRNMLAVQFFNAVLGAATAVIIFLCARDIFGNVRVAKVASVAVAFYPSLVLWSAQGLKDGPVVFSLALCMLATLRLGRKTTVTWLAVLVLALFCVLALRFYVFYMMVVTVAGAFVIGMRAVTAQSMVRQFVVIVTMGLAMTYFGVTRTASVQLEQYGSLEKIQQSRADAAESAKSGFGRDVDVSTTSGALETIPIGLLYLLFAPFPWQMLSLRQSLPLPEMVIWWASFPLLVLGVWFSLKYRLRQMSPIWIFTSMLTLVYSVFQGNIGTAYRQRSQLLVFYFIFVAVGLVLVKEKQEMIRKRRAAEKAAGRLRPSAPAVQAPVGPPVSVQRKSSATATDANFRPLQT
jgi:hypothetical protein